MMEENYTQAIREGANQAIDILNTTGLTPDDPREQVAEKVLPDAYRHLATAFGLFKVMTPKGSETEEQFRARFNTALNKVIETVVKQTPSPEEELFQILKQVFGGKVQVAGNA
jgi:hypothetical protein